jgi:hypothetical protein
MMLISNAYLDGVQRHRRTVFEMWSTYIKPHIGAANAAACQALAIEAFDASLKAITLDHDRHLAKAGGALMQATDPLRQSFPGRVAHERAALETQTALHVALPMAPLAPHVVVNATGRNTNVNVGSGSAHQTVQENLETGALVDALAQLLAELRHRQADPDLTAIVVDAKAEAEAPKPNKLKLASLLNGTAIGVQALGSAPAAWDMVMTAARALGLM